MRGYMIWLLENIFFIRLYTTAGFTDLLYCRRQEEIMYIVLLVRRLYRSIRV